MFCRRYPLQIQQPAIITLSSKYEQQEIDTLVGSSKYELREIDTLVVSPMYEQQEIDTLVRIQIVKEITMDNLVTSVKRSQVYNLDEAQWNKEAGRERSKPLYSQVRLKPECD